MNCGGILYTTNAKEVHGNKSGICQLSDRCSCMFAQKLHVVIADRSVYHISMCCVYFRWCTVCVYMSMWVVIADQSVYYTRLYTTCWLLLVILGRCNGAGDTTVAEKLGRLLLGHNSS